MLTRTQVRENSRKNTQRPASARGDVRTRLGCGGASRPPPRSGPFGRRSERGRNDGSAAGPARGNRIARSWLAGDAAPAVPDLPPRGAADPATGVRTGGADGGGGVLERPDGGVELAAELAPVTGHHVLRSLGVACSSAGPKASRLPAERGPGLEDVADRGDGVVLHLLAPVAVGEEGAKDGPLVGADVDHAEQCVAGYVALQLTVRKRSFIED